MANFTGTNGSDTITPESVSPGVTAVGAAAPSDAPDTIDGKAGVDFLDGGGGNDLIFGGSEDDTILGGAGQDEIHGDGGGDTVVGGVDDDTIFLGAGADVLSWRPGDGSDVAEAGDDSDLDRLSILGGADAERYDVFTGAGRVKVVHDLGAAELDLNAFEFLSFDPLAGTDVVALGNLVGTGTTRVDVNFGVSERRVGDGALDELSVDGRDVADTITVARSNAESLGPARVTVAGLSHTLSVDGVETGDRIVLNGLGGDDVLRAVDADADAGTAPVDLLLTLDGGSGNDTLSGGSAADTLIGGEGNDVVAGGLGNDIVRLGTGNDVYTHRQLSGFDTVEGGFNFDRLIYETLGDVLISRDGGRVRFDEDIGTDLLDMAGVERIDIVTGGLGGGVSIGNLESTGVIRVRVDAAASLVVEGERQTNLFVAATAGNDTIVLTTAGNDVTIGGLPWLIEFLDVGSGNGLQFGTGDGNDTLDTSGLTFPLGRFFVNLGKGDDLFIATESRDTISGDEGTDTVVYSGSDRSVAVDLAKGGGIGGDAEEDSYTDVENVTGSSFADIIGGSIAGNALTGGGGDDQLFGRGGSDTLVGGTGVDRTDGGTGDDTHRVDNGADIVVERFGEGSDTVLTSVSYVLTDAMHVEILNAAVATATTPISLTGNVRSNSLTGNSGANLLDGGGGADTMRGGRGNDVYVVDNLDDKVVESSATGGIDTVRSSVSFVLGAHLDNLTLTGAATANGTGNDAANTLVGNIANNVLRGGPGVDKLSGDRGADTLSGGRGNDSLTGGGGADDFLFDSPLGPAANVDRIEDFGTGADRILLDRAIFTGIAANGVLDASAFALGTAAGDASDRILYDSATGRIFYDADGTGSAASPIHFATVDAGTPLSSANFVAVLG